MTRKGTLKFDTIGLWSEIKLEILQEYAKVHAKILAAQRKSKRVDFKRIYIDAFAGAGVHISKRTGDLVPGSPLNALSVHPPYHEYHLIDLDGQKVEFLRKRVGDRKDVFLYEGDCNEILPKKVFPRVKYKDYSRALCFLDPYGLHLKWDVIETAGKLGTIDMFLNFPVADMNRNVFWRNPEGVDPADIARMNAFWGDESWRQAAYSPQPPDMFGYEVLEKNPNETIASAFQERLKKVAGFQYVLKRPMRNSTGAIVYYLFFASQKSVTQRIVEHIFFKTPRPMETV
jgi:three-Cys-motif partner protein